MADVVVDTKGMKCPLPVLKARKALKALPAGGTMEVQATDPGAVKDFEHFCTTTGAHMLDCRQTPDGVLIFTMKKAS